MSFYFHDHYYLFKDTEEKSTTSGHYFKLSWKFSCSSPQHMGFSTMSQSWTYTQIRLHHWAVDPLTFFLTSCWPIWYTLEIWAVVAELNCSVQPKSGVKSVAGREIKRWERNQEVILQNMISRQDLGGILLYLSVSHFNHLWSGNNSSALFMALIWRFPEGVEVRSLSRALGTEEELYKRLFFLLDIPAQMWALPKCLSVPRWGLPSPGSVPVYPMLCLGVSVPLFRAPFYQLICKLLTLWDHKPPIGGDFLNLIFPSLHCTWQVLNKTSLINFKIMCFLLLPGALIFLFKS